MENETLQLNYEVSPKEFRKIWVEMFKKSLPSVISFWGVAVFFSFLCFYFLDAKLFFGLVTFVFAAIPISLALMNYQAYMKTAQENYSMLSSDERQVQITFERYSDGFDSRNGKSFSHIAWESIKEVWEFEDSFVMNRTGNMFYIPKSAFRDESEIRFLRFLISANVQNNVKLIDS